MKKILFLLLIWQSLWLLPAQKMQLQRLNSFSPSKAKSPEFQIPEPRRHPYIGLLNNATMAKSRTSNREKLLVILVDFQEETTDDPNTTGNGKFMLQPDPSYLYSIGAPPHNREYFEANLEAMRYYYLAVSAEGYNLKYDVYPRNKPAYTLPHPMGYYNPPGASSELFVNRMEEYFKTAFEIADHDDPEIDFSAYGNYMIIHAGSDWQHDIAGDTPSDIPSFFIRVGSGKEAVVDNGSVSIEHACNVPSTIAQDFTVTESSRGSVHSGYGALNAVLVHEFGHSLGMVDLYDVYSYRPMVGMFDIMDSGGSGILVDSLPNGDLVFVEGALPALPGPFSRNLMFKDYYLEKGYYKEYPDYRMFEPLSLATPDAKQSGNEITPHTYRVPLNDKEYLLVENRSVDPDNDGGTALYGTLDSRVVLYPTPFDDPTNTPTYEYDYLLPSFIKADGSAVGAGMLVWHVNEEVIYDQGHSYDDGNWVSNFDSNTVNTDYFKRGVSVIEADGLNDLGSDYSMYWTGTPYEYFHAKKPVLDEDGLFVNWSQQEWKPALNSGSKPPLLDSKGLPGMYHLSGIGNPLATMSFQVNSGFFEQVETFDFSDPNLITAPIINSGFSNCDLPAIHSGQIDLLSNVDGTWQNLMGTFTDPISSYDYRPLVTDNNNDGIKELLTVKDFSIRFTDFATDQMTIHEVPCLGRIATEPLSLGNRVFAYMKSQVFQNEIYDIRDFAPYGARLPDTDVQKLAGWDNMLLQLGSGSLWIRDTEDFMNRKGYMLPERFGDIEPLIYKSDNPELLMIFVMSNNGNLYRIYKDAPELIFTNHGTAKPGQLGLTTLGNISPVIFFGLGSDLYALKADGTLITGFPYRAAHNISSTKSPLSLSLDEEDLMFFPLENSGYLAISQKARLVADKSLLYQQSGKDDYLYYHPDLHKLYWYYPDSEGRLFVHSLSGVLSDPILFNGYRNGGSGVFESSFSEDGSLEADQQAFIYPNPVNKRYFKIRLTNYTGYTKAKIFDISGSLVRSWTYPESLNNPREIELDSSGLSSGVYILSLENSGKHKRIKFAVEK
jgi:M6 family metalloprotease-like protein